MRCINKIGGCALLLLIVNAHAGFATNTAHSRANCFGFNESVTWNGMVNHWWRVESVHINNHSPGRHIINTGMNFNWRAAAFHTREWEGANGDNWHVQGYHFFRDDNGREVYDVFTDAFDCSQYDGWWDK